MWVPVLGWAVLLSPVLALNVTLLDCEMRLLALRYAQYLQPWRDDAPFQQVHDALRLQELCHVSYETHIVSPTTENIPLPKTVRRLNHVCHNKQHCIYVDRNAKLDSSTLQASTVLEALELSRQLSNPSNTTIIIREGIHALHSTIMLGPKDSGLSLVGYPGEDVWLSGGIEVPKSTKWTPFQQEILVANLTNLLHGRELPRLVSLFSQNKRLVRARYPNGDPEVTQWGYNSPLKLRYSISPEEVLEWHRPPKGRVPDFTYVDLRHHDPPKNDSTQEGYNIYASGSGGVCADLWGPEADSYWCSNASSGGWAEVDQECAVTGQLGIPVGMDYNHTSDVGRRMESWGDLAKAGIVHAWHSQSWAMHMFAIESTAVGSFRFAKGGGRQGGRNWCRCDQCTYAGGWCGQHQDPPVPDDRLISGTWLVENVLAELDQPGEYFFDPESRLLYLYPNETDIDDGRTNLRLALLETLIQIQGAEDVSISGLGFRDSAATYMGDWSAPSGGDWALHRGGAIFIEDSDAITVKNCTFRRLDGNAVFLSQKTRQVTVRRNIFEWLGENAIATWGATKDYDATSRKQPIGTVIEGNFMRELGIYQKQSSGVGHNKAAKTTIRNNIMFNMPRAAINFNDMMGGGDVVTRNLIFNSCRESGDHGPINSWDRQPFLTDLGDGQKTFIPLARKIAFNFIIANYGASQGVDNDDGSSWYHISNNVFYTAEGFKMDYGGHDSIFQDNLVLAYPDKPGQPKCIGFGSFLPGHGHTVRRNTCLVPRDEPIIGLGTCDHSNVDLHDNRYFTPNGTATVECGYGNPPLPFEEVQQRFGLEQGSTVSTTPISEQDITTFVLETLFPNKQYATSS